MKKRKPSSVDIVHCSSGSEIDGIGVVINRYLQVVIKHGDEFYCLMPHDASRLSKMLSRAAREALLLANNIANEED